MGKNDVIICLQGGADHLMARMSTTTATAVCGKRVWDDAEDYESGIVRK